jgi:hypothetical protein
MHTDDTGVTDVHGFFVPLLAEQIYGYPVKENLGAGLGLPGLKK